MIADQTIDNATKIAQYIVDHPEEFPNISGEEMFNLMFGEYQRFATKFNRAINNDEN